MWAFIYEWQHSQRVSNALEFVSHGEESHELNVAHGRLEVVVEGCDGGVGDVVVRGNAAEVSDLQAALGKGEWIC